MVLIITPSKTYRPSSTITVVVGFVLCPIKMVETRVVEGNLAIVMLIQQPATRDPSKATKACTAIAVIVTAILPRLLVKAL